VVAPVPDFQVAGIGLTAVALQGLSVPGASLDTVHVGSLTGGSVPLGSITLPNLQLPAASVADIVSQGLDVRMVGSQESLGGGGGLLSVSLDVVPAARVQVDELTISGVQASASVGSVQLTDVVLPFEVLDVTLSQLGIETVTVPTVEVS
jgi:hypothetical protein